jgi:immune inhibitor A
MASLKGASVRKIIIVLLLTCVLLAGCGSADTTTAAEPQFDSISTDKTTAADADLYAVLSNLDPIPANRIDLAIAIEDLDPAILSTPPDQPTQTYQVGDIRSFWTHNSDTLQFNRITVKLMIISVHAYFWQDEASQPLNAKGQIATPEDWTVAAESFDKTYELVRAVFGHEAAPALNGDPRLYVIHSDSLGKVGGYFGQTDLLPAAVEPYSNEGNYFYISNTWSSGIASDYYKVVLAHEFQHMIQKNMDANEEGWLNEGMSMLAQQVAGMRGDNWVSDYLTKPDQSLWYWSSKPLDYGQSYLYVDYLYEQMGQDFIKAVAADPLNGIASIDETLVQFNSSRNADELYTDAITAAYFNKPALASGQFAFKYPTLPAVTPRYEFTTLPAVYEGTVQQYGGADIITFTSDKKATITFTGDQRVKLTPTDAHSGNNFWWSNRYDATFATLTRTIDLTGVTRVTLNYWAWYDIEEDYDYAYILVSSDNGTHWDLIPATSSRETNPNGQNLSHGFSGISGGGKDPAWIEETADLSAYAGKQILLRFAMQNDLVVNNYGFAIDDLSIPEIGWRDDVESGNNGWITEGFVLSQNYVPQVWSVRAVEQRTDGTIVVHDMTIAKGNGRLKIDFKDLEKLIMFVIGETRDTTMPASYRIEVRP